MNFKFGMWLTFFNILQGEWGMNQSDEDEEMTRRNNVIKDLVSFTRAKVRVLHESCQVSTN